MLDFFVGRRRWLGSRRKLEAMGSFELSLSYRLGENFFPISGALAMVSVRRSNRLRLLT